MIAATLCTLYFGYDTYYSIKKYIEKCEHFDDVKNANTRKCKVITCIGDNDKEYYLYKNKVIGTSQEDVDEYFTDVDDKQPKLFLTAIGYGIRAIFAISVIKAVGYVEYEHETD